ncbi:MAG: long-chain fatty acid--CoA ligase, partial [Clostridia bacterium]|nr:long-chain fatty acid--CoA ligase [Clostridia bacterium]
AIISVKEDCHLSEQEVNDFCKGMPRYKRPRKIIFADVPRNPTGKIEKPKLRELYAGANLVEQQTKK